MPFDPDSRDYDKCPIEAAMKVVGGKWKSVILTRLLLEGTLRFGVLRRTIGRITPRMLTAQLRELEQDGLVKRKIYPEVPPRVEYSVTPLGQALEPALLALADWAVDYMKPVSA